MRRRVLESAIALLISATMFAGCHMCQTECQVTKVCCPEVTTEKVEKKGWDIECKQICIPPIHCPFSDPCEVKCGKVIAVRKLKADKIDCGEKCVVEYKLIDACTGNGGRPCQSCLSGQSCQSCQAGQNCSATAIPAEQPPIEYHPAPTPATKESPAPQ